jgi:hypothetical protein
MNTIMKPLNLNGISAPEREAIAYFLQVGREEVERQYKQLDEVAQTRFDEYYAVHRLTKWGAMPPCSFLTENEQVLMWKLQLALTLCVDAQEEAKQRILQRRQARRAPVNL